MPSRGLNFVTRPLGGNEKLPCFRWHYRCACPALEGSVTRTIALTIAVLFLGAGVLEGGQRQKPKKQKDEPQTAVHASHDGGSSVAISVSWGARDIEIVRRHYAGQYRDLPPGLRKKYARTGELPPGWQKKMAPLPASLERACAPLPGGYRRGVIEGHAVIYNSRGIIIDVAVLF